MRHTIAVIVENKSGVLTRIAGLFSRRSFNIDGLSVGATDNPEYSRMTITVEGDNEVLEQVIKQLSKLINVIRVSELAPAESVERELAIIKVTADKESRSEIMQIVNIFRAKIIDVQPKSLTIEITGDEGKVEKFIELMKPFGILELTRTGKVRRRFVYGLYLPMIEAMYSNLKEVPVKGKVKYRDGREGVVETIARVITVE